MSLMSNDILLKLAESGEWKERAIELLQKQTDACLDVIQSFVSDYWQNLESDEQNLLDFETYAAEFNDAFH